MRQLRNHIGAALLASLFATGFGASAQQVYHVSLNNTCGASLAVVINYVNTNNVRVTQGWWAIAPGQTVSTHVNSTNPYFYFYARAEGFDQHWDGSGDTAAINRLIVGERFLASDSQSPNGSNRQVVSMFSRKADSPELLVTFACGDLPTLVQDDSSHQSATLEETLDWLSRNLPTLGWSYTYRQTINEAVGSSVTGNVSVSYTVTGMGCYLRASNTVEDVDTFELPSGGPRRGTDTSAFAGQIPLGRISIITTQTKRLGALRKGALAPNAPIYQITLEASSKVIRVHTDHGDLSDDNWGWSGTDQELSGRLAKALAHAVALCRGKEPF